MPAVRGPGAPVRLEDVLLLLLREFGSLAGVEAHGDDLELLPDVPGERAEAPEETFDHHAAEHRALEVHQVEDDGLLPEVLGRASRRARTRP